MARCNSCKKEKIEEEYSYRNKLLGKRQEICKTCTRKRIRLHYANNKTYYLNKASKRNKEVTNELRLFIWNYLDLHPCVDCNEADPIVLEFDHLRDKKLSIANLVKNSSSIVTIKEEIAKCEVRCANCHRRKTARDFGWHKLEFASVAQLD